MNGTRGETTPLLRDEEASLLRDEEDETHVEVLDFAEEDPENPRNWPRWRKWINVALIALMAILSPLGSSMFTPGIKQIATDLNTTDEMVFGATTGYVVLLGFGPMIWSSLSETFGRRPLYIYCFLIFTALQIPTALADSIEVFIAVRTIAGFFGSVGIANGGGSLNDLFLPSERASVFAWYLLGPILGPSIGPLLGGFIVELAGWRWVFGILAILSGLMTVLSFMFLKETYHPKILGDRCKRAAEKDGKTYTFPNEDTRGLAARLKTALVRPPKMLATQPIIIIMGLYQAAVFGNMYTVFLNMQNMFSREPYSFGSIEVGCAYIPAGVGFVFASQVLVPRIDSIYNDMTARNDGVSKPEFRLPLANIGAVLLPLSILGFGWTLNFKLHWAIVLFFTIPFGIGQVIIFNTIQNYYIESFSNYAASAIAAGSLFRSLVGGIAPRFSTSIFDSLGYGWGWSVFAAVLVVLTPVPALFIRYGERIRNWTKVEI